MLRISALFTKHQSDKARNCVANLLGRIHAAWGIKTTGEKTSTDILLFEIENDSVIVHRDRIECDWLALCDLHAAFAYSPVGAGGTEASIRCAASGA